MLSGGWCQFSSGVVWVVGDIVAVSLRELVAPNVVSKRDRVLSEQELERIIPVLRSKRGDGYHDCMMLILLTLLRREEAANLKWSDVHWGKNEITIADTKNGREHVLPLSRQAMELLGGRPRISDLVFVNSVDRKMGNWHRVQLALYEESGTSGWHRHDLRRSGATLLGEMGTDPHVIEAALNHITIHSRIASIYNRARYRDQVAEALQMLADKLDAIGGGNVVAFPAKEIA